LQAECDRNLGGKKKYEKVCVCVRERECMCERASAEKGCER